MRTRSVNELLAQLDRQHDGPNHLPMTRPELRQLVKAYYDTRTQGAHIYCRISRAITGSVCPDPTFDDPELGWVAAVDVMMSHYLMNHKRYRAISSVLWSLLQNEGWSYGTLSKSLARHLGCPELASAPVRFIKLLRGRYPYAAVVHLANDPDFDFSDSGDIVNEFRISSDGIRID